MKLLKSIKKLGILIRNFYFPGFAESHLQVKVTIGRMLATLFAILIIFGFWFLLPMPKATITSGDAATTSLDQQITINFSRPVQRNSIRFSLSPEVSGTWSWQKPFMGSRTLFTRLVFTPETMFDPNTSYKIKLNQIKGITSIKNQGNNFAYDFTTENYPSVAKVTPQKDAKEIKIDSLIMVDLDRDNDNRADFTFELTPKVEYDLKLDGKRQNYTLIPKATFLQNTAYNLKVYRTILIYDKSAKKVIKRNSPELQYDGNFTTQTAPGLTSFIPNGDHILTTTQNAKITFSADMDKSSVESNIEILPKISGNFVWQDDKTLEYRFAKNLDFSTTYTFKIKKGTKNKAGGFFIEDAKSLFTTIGNVYVAYFTPNDGAGGVRSGSNIIIAFDQAVDHSSAESHFSFSDNRKGSFSWSENVMTFNPNEDLTKSASYTATIAAGVKSINGLDSKQSFSTTFYTEENIVKLNIPVYYQKYTLSCEVAALKMALGYRGVQVTEDNLMSLVGYDPTPHIGNTWGDPHTAFVGSVNGKDMVDGYGVYWGPIESTAKNYRSAQAFTGWSTAQLADKINNGNPVIIWGYYGNGYPVSWNTPDGKSIPAYKGEHARTVIGFYGPANNPTKFIINDPIVGQITWSTGQLLANWSSFGNAGVVVY